MRMSALIVAATLLTAAGAQEKPSKEEIEASVKKVKELRKERIAALKAAAEISRQLYQAARVEGRDALEARMALLKAELEVAETESDRIALYKGAIGALKQYEDIARLRFRAGRGNELEVQTIKAKRLEVEIQLEQAKMKVKVAEPEAAQPRRHRPEVIPPPRPAAKPGMAQARPEPAPPPRPAASPGRE